MRTILPAAALGAALMLGHAFAAEPATRPMPTSALRGADSTLPRAGSGVALPGGGASDQSLTPDGAILPGTTRPGGHSSN